MLQAETAGAVLNFRRPLLGLLLLGTCLLPAGAWAVPDAGELRETIRRATEQLRSTGRATVAGQLLLSAQSLPEIYEARGFRPLWTGSANEEALLGEIGAVGGDGLDPADYHFEVLRGVLERRRSEPDSAAAAASADLLLTDALLRLVAHLHFGKLDATTGEPRWDLGGRIRGEPAVTVAARMATGSGLAILLNDMRPAQPMYGRLKAAYARYRIVAQSGGWSAIPAGRMLQLDMEDPRVALLRRRLAISDDFQGQVTDSPRFEPALEAALQRFQARHELEADGLLGPGTLRALNRPVEAKLERLRANLERSRWLLAELRGRFLLIDPAGRQVVLMNNSRPVLELAAGFAPAARNATEFRSTMSHLVVNPDWVLPTVLVESQVAPLARQAPAELSARGLVVFNSAGRQIDAADADWSEPGKLIVRQSAGPRSFLGRIRFAIPNQAQLSLHDAPERADLMPGSVRLPQSEALAAALAGPTSAWTPDTLRDALDSGVPTTLGLGVAIPVLYAPWTAWVGTDGSVAFRSGYEQRDARIVAGLGMTARGP